MRYPIPSAVWLVIALIVIFTPVFYSVMLGPFFFNGDHFSHAEAAIRLQDSQMLGVPHVLYHVLFMTLYNIFPFVDLTRLSTFLMVALRAMLGLIIFLLLRAQLSGQLSDLWIGGLVILFLLTYSPIFLWHNQAHGVTEFFLHHISHLNHLVYHNPTQNLLLIFVVPAQLVALGAIVPQPFRSANQRIFVTLLAAALVMLMSLSKPSYSIALLPALGLAALYRTMRRLPVDWSLLILGLGVPFLLILALQYVVAYADPERAGVGIGWLVFFRSRGFREWEVGLKLILSVLFPLVAYLLHARHVIKDDLLNFSWLVFGVSLIWTYFFYEDGKRLTHGNFAWSGYAALFGLMFSTILFLLRHYTTQAFVRTPRAILTASAFALHLVAGIYTYLFIVVNSEFPSAVWRFISRTLG
ncbi:MAG: hypothetical protein SNJ58_06080 [Aggregatilineales bacterium]